MPFALNVSRFQIPKERMRECEPLLGDFPQLAKNAEGFVSTSVWRKATDLEQCVRVTFFASPESMRAFYDQILKSDQLIETIIKYGVAPDVLTLNVNHIVGFDPKEIHRSEFMSLSVRAMDPGMGMDWVEKLTGNFEEVEVLPGFEGAVVASTEPDAERVGGLAFWQTEENFQRSVPDRPDYTIDLYSLYR